MTLQEAIEELNLALSRRQVVNIGFNTLSAFKHALGSDMNAVRYKSFANLTTGEIRYVMKTSDAEELRDLARHHIVRQVANKLMGAA